MIITKASFHVETSLSEYQVEELLKENIAKQTPGFWLWSREGFMGKLNTERREFEFADFYWKEKCTIVKGNYTTDEALGTTIHFDIQWAFFEYFRFVFSSLAVVIFLFICSARLAPLPIGVLIAWPVIVFAFLGVKIGFNYILSIKRTKAKLIGLFKANVRSVMED
ncbi:MAG: hypothetical protein CVV04_10470 [Firmicutes bacterium HGW-Firmicutes-9]|jgi:hypothetical protein|nr:MAG: hypothetical protein CVV04_10470 [Firmicutes bacterium HGW-Firmicutes-9]